MDAANVISQTLAAAQRPLTEDQHILLAGAVAVCIEKAVATERARHMTERQVAEFGALCVMNRRLKLTPDELLREFKAERGIS